jgi:hypothetical protein
MWDEKNDKKLREAAENFKPPLDESAWQKMEKMLDENLPQKKDRKRILFFLPVLLILGGLLFFIFFYNKGSHNLKTSDETPAPSAYNNTKEKAADKPVAASPNSAINGDEKTSTASGVMKNITTIVRKEVKNSNDFVKPGNNNKNVDKVVSEGEVKSTDLNIDKNIESSKPTNLSNSYSENKDEKELTQTKVDESKKEDKNMLPATTVSNPQNPAGKTSKGKTKKKNSFADNFSLGISAGPGVSAVGSKEGKLTLDLGIVAAHRFSKHFGVHSGVFVSKKIYSATPAEYSIPGGATYNYLQKINANCNVIDIPLNLDYYFGEKRNHSWFASAGLSSYLMKKESYDYVYKTPAGQVYNKNWSISNQNKHFFSVLDLSVGYQYLINNKFSVSAQPYADLPLTGIGAGKVKLFSEGILFTIKAKPFLKKGK